MTGRPPSQVRDYVASRHGAALGARLRRLSERIDREAQSIYAQFGVKFEQRWFGVMNQLDLKGALRVGDLAAALGISHAAVSQIRGRLVRAGYVSQKSDREDARTTRLSLTPSGVRLVAKLRPLWTALDVVSENLNREAGDAVTVIARVEAGLDKASLWARVKPVLERAASRADRTEPPT